MAWKDKVDSIRDGIWLASLISVPLTTILTFVFFGMWAMYGDEIVAKAREELSIDRNYELILQALGEDRAIRQPPGLSYVQEPVYVGETIVVNLVIQRTEWGSACIFEDGHAVFVQPNGIIIGGSSIPTQRQVSTDLTRFQIPVNTPDTRFIQRSELNQRWAVYFALDYECYGHTVIEETDLIPFIMRDRPRNEGMGAE